MWMSDTSCCDPVLSFDGTDDYLSKAFVHDGNSTIFMVVDTSSTQGGTLFASEDGDIEPNGFEIEIANSNLLKFY